MIWGCACPRSISSAHHSPMRASAALSAGRGHDSVFILRYPQGKEAVTGIAGNPGIFAMWARPTPRSWKIAAWCWKSISTSSALLPGRLLFSAGSRGAWLPFSTGPALSPKIWICRPGRSPAPMPAGGFSPGEPVSGPPALSGGLYGLALPQPCWWWPSTLPHSLSFPPLWTGGSPMSCAGWPSLSFHGHRLLFAVSPGSPPAGRRPLSHFYKKNLAIYGLATLLYLPIQWYAGRQLPHSLLAWVRVLFFDSTYYHLWYFPAVFLGVWIAWQLQRRLPFSRALLAASLLYLAGLLGDSYSALLPRLPLLDTLYQAWLPAVFLYEERLVLRPPLFCCWAPACTPIRCPAWHGPALSASASPC